MIWITIFTFCLALTQIRCVSSIDVSPCKLAHNTTDRMICSYLNGTQLVEVFERLEKSLNKSEKHFKGLIIDYSSMTELKDNTFKDITFDQILIEFCSQLTKINPNAFNGTQSVTKELGFIWNKQLSSPNNSLFEAISKFTNLNYLDLGKSNITEIPSNAFNKLGKLISVVVSGPSIEKIGNNAFSSLNSLNEIRILDTSIVKIPEFAFAFDQESKLNLRVQIYNKELNSTGFHENSLAHFKRPTLLDFAGFSSNMKFLEERVFKKFLTINPNNRINMEDQYLFDCNNCESFWIKKNPALAARIQNVQCSNGLNVLDPDNWKLCH